MCVCVYIYIYIYIVYVESQVIARDIMPRFVTFVLPVGRQFLFSTLYFISVDGCLIHLGAVFMYQGSSH